MDTLITLKETTMKTYLNHWTGRCFLLCWGCLLALAAHAHGFAVGELFVRHPYTVPSLAGSQTGAVYFKGIKNAGKEADQLLSAKTQVADKVEIHEMTMDGDVMKMRPLSSIEIPAGGEVSVAKGNPNGYHLMLLGLKQHLKDGDRFPVWLSFKRSGEVKVEVYVQTPKASAQVEEHKH
jgi:copper(I)-binding protein